MVLYPKTRYNLTQYEFMEDKKRHEEEENFIKEYFQFKDKEQEVYAHLTRRHCDVEHLDDICAQYGIYGTYYHYIVDEDSNRIPGLYFIFGLDEELIKKDEFDFPRLLAQQKLYPGLICTRIQFVKISGRAGHVVTNSVIEMAGALNSLRIICAERKLPIPNQIGKGELDFLHFQLQESEKEGAGDLSMLCTKSIDNCIKTLCDHDKNDNLFKQRYNDYCYSNRNHTSGKKMAFSYDFLKFCMRPSNLVSWKTVLRRFGSTNQCAIDKVNWVPFTELMKCFPDCLYAVLPGELGRVKRENPSKGNPTYARTGDVGYDRRIIIFGSQFTEIISFVELLVNFKGGGDCAQEIVDTGDFAAFTVPRKKYQNFRALANASDIKFAFDIGFISTPEYSGYNAIPILVRAQYAQEVETILSSMNSTEINKRVPDKLTELFKGYNEFSPYSYPRMKMLDAPLDPPPKEVKLTAKEREKLRNLKNLYHIIKLRDK